jgi:hypothetical protein
MSSISLNGIQYELCFESLIDQGTAWKFPCDARGQVDMDQFDDRVLHCYLYARTTIGREFMRPSVQSLPIV